MRILYVLPIFPAAAETFVTTEVRALRDLGQEVEVHTYASPPDGADLRLANRSLQDLPVEHGTWRAHLAGLVGCLRHPWLTFRLLLYSSVHSWRRPGQWLASLCWIPRSLGIYRRISAVKPDVVHLFWGHYPALLGWLVLIALPDIVLTTSLGAYDLTLGYGGSRPVARKAGMLRTYAAVNRPALRRWGVPEDKILVEYHGIDLSLVPDPAPQQIPGRIVSAGRLIPDKGMDDALRAFARVHDVRPDATLKILGEGPDRSRLERLARDLGVNDAVDFAGLVPHREVFRSLAEAEVLLFLTRHEAERLPNVVKEAMACRTTCVVNDCPGLGELLADGSLGFVITPGDVDAAARSVLGVLEEEKERTRVRLEAALRHVTTHFDPHAIARRLAAQWAVLAGRRSGGSDPSADPGARRLGS